MNVRNSLLDMVVGANFDTMIKGADEEEGNVSDNDVIDGDKDDDVPWFSIGMTKEEKMQP